METLFSPQKLPPPEQARIDLCTALFHESAVTFDDSLRQWAEENLGTIFTLEPTKNDKTP